MTPIRARVDLTNLAMVMDKLSELTLSYGEYIFSIGINSSPIDFSKLFTASTVATGLSSRDRAVNRTKEVIIFGISFIDFISNIRLLEHFLILL